MPKGINAVLGLTLAVLVVATWSLQPDPSRPNFEIMPNMARSIPADAFAASTVFPDGKTLRTAAPGTIVRGLLPFAYEATEADAIRAGEELTNPFSADDEQAMARGAVVYANFCQTCHGAGGNGDGPVTLRGVPPPLSYHDESALTKKDGQLFHILTYGQKNMPGYAAQISREDRWKAILHVRLLQQRAAADQD
jgi:mono/diheme cytochrome c family protein